MKEDELADILNEHANALNKEEEIRPELTNRYLEDAPELTSLIQTAELVKMTLKPISAAAFKEQLRQRLDTYAPSEVIIRPPAPGTRMLVLAVAATGSLLSMVGLAVVLIRRLRATGQGRTQAATTAA